MIAPDSHVEKLKADLKALRGVLEGRSGPGDYLQWFDEFLRECELDLALHSVCDYLLEDGVGVEVSIVERIQALHALMNLDDDCVERLRSKTRVG